jgi:hypothetical protein
MKGGEGMDENKILREAMAALYRVYEMDKMLDALNLQVQAAIRSVEVILREIEK